MFLKNHMESYVVEAFRLRRYEGGPLIFPHCYLAMMYLAGPFDLHIFDCYHWDSCLENKILSEIEYHLTSGHRFSNYFDDIERLSPILDDKSLAAYAWADVPNVYDISTWPEDAGVSCQPKCSPSTALTLITNKEISKEELDDFFCVSHLPEDWQKLPELLMKYHSDVVAEALSIRDREGNLVLDNFPLLLRFLFLGMSNEHFESWNCIDDHPRFYDPQNFCAASWIEAEHLKSNLENKETFKFTTVQLKLLEKLFKEISVKELLSFKPGVISNYDLNDFSQGIRPAPDWPKTIQNYFWSQKVQDVPP